MNRRGNGNAAVSPRLSGVSSLLVLAMLLAAAHSVWRFTFVSDAEWVNYWRAAGVPALTPRFADLRTVAAAAYGKSVGLSILESARFDPWERIMNYPRIWAEVGFAAELWRPRRVEGVAYCFAMLYFASVANVARRTHSWSVACFALMPAALLCVERGNNDLLVFVLTAAAALQTRPSVRGMIVVLAGALKLYPLVLLPTALPPKSAGRLRRATSIVLTIGCAMLSALSAGDLRGIFQGNTASGRASYGLMTATRMIEARGGSQIAAAALVCFIVFISYRVARQSLSQSAVPEAEGRDARELFKFGCTLYASTFVSSANWDYRLIMTLLAVPMLRSSVLSARASCVGLGCIAVSLLSVSPLASGIAVAACCQLAKVAMCGFSIAGVAWVTASAEGASHREPCVGAESRFSGVVNRNVAECAIARRRR